MKQLQIANCRSWGTRRVCVLVVIQLFPLSALYVLNHFKARYSFCERDERKGVGVGDGFHARTVSLTLWDSCLGTTRFSFGGTALDVARASIV